MRESPFERRLANAIRTASESLRAAANTLEEINEALDAPCEGNFERRELKERCTNRHKQGGEVSYGREPDPDDDGERQSKRGAQGGGERCDSEAHPPLPPYPPYPPFPPHPPMQPIVIMCGCSCHHGAGHPVFPGYGLNSGSFLTTYPGAANPWTAMQASAAGAGFSQAPGSTIAASQTSSWQAPLAAATVPAGGISFSASASPATQPTVPGEGSTSQ